MGENAISQLILVFHILSTMYIIKVMIPGTTAVKM